MEATTSQERKKQGKMENTEFEDSLSRDDHTEAIFWHSIKTTQLTFLSKVFPL